MYAQAFQIEETSESMQLITNARIHKTHSILIFHEYIKQEISQLYICVCV